MSLRPARLVVVASAVAAAWPAGSSAKTGCPSEDLRTSLAAAGQGINGRVIAIGESFLTIVAESAYDRSTIAFDETVRVYGTSLPAVRQGRIGVVLRRVGERWTASRCDVVPGWRMANALHGREPCPKPGVRIAAVKVRGRTAELTLRLVGDVTTLRIDSGRTIRRRQFAQPGTASIVERVRYARAGTYRVEVRAEGGFGPGCGTDRRRYATARRTVVVG